MSALWEGLRHFFFFLSKRWHGIKGECFSRTNAFHASHGIVYPGIMLIKKLDRDTLGLYQSKKWSFSSDKHYPTPYHLFILGETMPKKLD